MAGERENGGDLKMAVDLGAYFRSADILCHGEARLLTEFRSCPPGSPDRVTNGDLIRSHITVFQVT